jgi:hypothetical protein
LFQLSPTQILQQAKEHQSIIIWKELQHLHTQKNNYPIETNKLQNLMLNSVELLHKNLTLCSWIGAYQWRSLPMSLGKTIYRLNQKAKNPQLRFCFFILKQTYLVKSSMTISTCDVPSFSTTTTVPAPALLISCEKFWRSTLQKTTNVIENADWNWYLDVSTLSATNIA